MTKEEELNELHKTIWRIANDLRGSVDGWDFKSYVLGMLFYRFISEDLTHYLNEQEHLAGDPDFNYPALPDALAESGRDGTVQEKGYFILPSELFQNVHARCHNDTNLNETLAAVFAHIEGSAIGTPSEGDLKGLFSDFDVNSNKLGATVPERNARLCKIIDAVADMNLGKRLSETTNDTFGDAYEFLMTMYASAAGKSGGEFFTPQEVSRLVALLAINGRKELDKVYDPACGSGSLLLQFRKVLGDKAHNFFGQEINLTTYNLCRINMFLHGVNFEHFDIRRGDTLTNPLHRDFEPFDAIGSNPPYALHWAGKNDVTLINDDRYAPAGVLAPSSKADLAFTMHILSSLSVSGTAAIVEFPGVLYRGGTEQKIREYLVSNNFIDAIIQMPDNLFFGVGIAVCIIVIKKSKATNDILFIDAAKDFIHEGNKNKLSEANIQRIYGAYMSRQEETHFAKLVPNTDVLANSVNLSVSSYVEPEDTSEKIDIRELNARIDQIVAREAELREKINAIIKDLED